MGTTQARAELKQAIVDYATIATNGNRAKVTHTIEFVRDCANRFMSNSEIDEAVLSFSPEHRAFIKEAIERLSAIVEQEVNESIAASEAEDNFISEQRSAFYEDDFDYDGVEAEVFIHKDKIVVKAIQYVDGFSKKLPKGGKYQGSGTGTWVYPLSKRAEFGQTTWQGNPIFLASPECK
jgi:formate dehydrogenase maturation protein FdhE